MANLNDFWPLPPLRRQVFTTIHRQIWPILDPFPPRICRRLKWMVPYSKCSIFTLFLLFFLTFCFVLALKSLVNFWCVTKLWVGSLSMNIWCSYNLQNWCLRHLMNKVSFILISMYSFKCETIVRSSAWSFGHSDPDPSSVIRHFLLLQNTISDTQYYHYKVVVG